MASNETTYNEEKVTTLLRNIGDYYRDGLKVAIQDDMQSKVVDKLAEIWYMEDAVTYWDGEVSAWNSMCTQINTKFSDIYKDINTCADNYAKACGTTWRKPSWTGVPAKISSNFQAVSSDGKRGITDHNTFETTRTTVLNNVKSDASTALDNVVKACADSGFIDGGTQAQIQSTVSDIKSKIINAVNTAQEDIAKNANTAKTNIESAVSANSSTSGS